MNGRFKSSNTRLGRLLHDGFQRRCAGADVLHLQVATAFEGMLHQACDIRLIFDNQNTGFTKFYHPTRTLQRACYPQIADLLILGKGGL